MWQSTKKYGHESGLSAAFRQWRANSHCNQVHGYALSIEFTFEADTLDHRNWVADFGGFKGLKTQLEELFDHKMLVAADDPHRSMFETMDHAGVMDVVVVEAVGCEAFAKLAFDLAYAFVEHHFPQENRPVRVIKCTVAEHGSNSASYLV